MGCGDAEKGTESSDISEVELAEFYAGWRRGWRVGPHPNGTEGEAGVQALVR